MNRNTKIPFTTTKLRAFASVFTHLSSEQQQIFKSLAANQNARKVLFAGLVYAI